MSKDETITRTLYLPSDWATDDEPLREFFQENFITYCQNGGKDLRKRAKSILKKDDPEYRRSRINSIYDNQKYRVWLFFDKLYDKHLDDNHKIDSIYKLSLEVERLDKDLKFQHHQPIYSSAIKGMLSRDYCKFFRDEFLVNEEYLDINHSYIPWYYSFEDNSKPKSYRLTDWVYSDQVAIEKKRIEIPKKVYNSFHKKHSYPKPSLPDFVKELKKHYKKWGVTETDIKQIYTNSDYSLHEKINIKSELIDGINLSTKSKDWFKFNISFGQRVYHKNAQFNKKYRKYINHPSMIGQDQSKCLIEHRNCLIYLYSNFILRYNFEEIFFKYKDLIEKLSFNIVNDRSLKEDLIQVFKNLIISEGKNFKSEIFKEQFNLSREEIDEIEKIVYCCAEFSNDQHDELGTWAIFIMGKLGIIYDVIYELFLYVNDEAKKLKDFSEELVRESDIKSRKDFKILFNKYLNFPTKSINHVPEVRVFDQIFSRFFPTFHAEMMIHKYKSYKNVANVAFKMESELMVRNVGKELIESEEEVPFYTIHDGIVCYKKDAEMIKRLIEEKSIELFHFTSPIEIEAIE